MTKVLVLDDRAINRKLLRELLGYKGYEVIEAIEGEAALELARTQQPGLIISDVVMPGMDGFEFVRRLGHDPAVAWMPVIFYTAAYVEPEAPAGRGVRCGAFP